VLQEDFVLRYGVDGTHKQHYLVRPFMFHDGVGSSGGHFTVAVREQKDGQYNQGDKWRYLDSARPVQFLSFDQLVYKSPTTVYGALLVAKTQPQDDPRPMLAAPPAPRYTNDPPCHCGLCLNSHHFWIVLSNCQSCPFCFKCCFLKQSLSQGLCTACMVYVSFGTSAN